MRPALLALLMTVVGSAGLGADEPLLDDRGVAYAGPRPANRIVSLAPHLTELLYTAGAGEAVVATVAHSDHPPPARELPRVGDAFHVDLERIRELEPDAVLAWASGTRQEVIAALEEAGVPVLVMATRDLDDIARQLLRIGALSGHTGAAEEAAAAYRDRLRALAVEPPAQPVRVFVQIAERPLYTVGGRHTITEIIRLCGGENVFGELETPAPSVALEAVVQRRPELIIAASSPSLDPDWRAVWRRWKGLPAVAGGDLETVPADLISRATTRLADGAEQVCALIRSVREARDGTA